MRRWLSILLLVFLPFQFSWAAVAGYCQHEADAASQHFGHHEHQQQDAGPSKQRPPSHRSYAQHPRSPCLRRCPESRQRSALPNRPLLRSPSPRRSSRSTRGFRAATSRWGQMAEIDVQDRVLIHPSLRGEAETVGEVTIVGAATHLEVWEQSRYVAHCAKHRLTEEDMVELSGLGY